MESIRISEWTAYLEFNWINMQWEKKTIQAKDNSRNKNVRIEQDGQVSLPFKWLDMK
jgi:hypothetical protein